LTSPVFPSHLRIGPFPRRRFRVRRPAAEPVRGGGRARLPLWGPALLTLLACLAVAGCLVTSQRIAELPGDATVSILSNTLEPERPGAPIFARLTAEDYRTNLRRIIVTYSTWISLIRTDPKPLLTKTQVKQFSEILARELPKLRLDQRLEFKFLDPVKNLDVLVEVYEEGEFLVFAFNALSKDLDAPGMRHVQETNKAFIVPQVGQLLTESPDFVRLKEPVDPDTVIKAQAQQHKIDLIAGALEAKTILAEEAEALGALALRSPYIRVAAFQGFLKKRETLGRARRQDLISEDEFQTRRKKLMAGLAATRPPTSAEEAAASTEHQAKLEMIREAVEKGTISETESGRLTKIVDASPALRLEELRDFFKRRGTLQQARAQELLSQAEYKTRLERLITELGR
jgi:hypothetical protein